MLGRAGLGRGAPAHRQPLGHAGRLCLLRPVVDRLAHGQHPRQALDHAQVQPVGGQGPAPQRPVRRQGVLETHIPTRPVAAVARGDGQPLGSPDGGVAIALQPQPPAQVGDAQGLDPRLRTRRPDDMDIAPLHIRGGGAPLRAAHIGPQPQGAGGAQLAHPPQGGGVHIRPQALRIQPRRQHEQFARPLAPAPRVGLPERPGKAAPHAETVAPLRRGRGVEPKLVPQAGVAHHKIHRRERQRGGVRALLVDPAQHPGTQGKFALAKEPIGRGTVAARARQLQPGDLQTPVGQPAHLERRAVDHDLVEAQPPQRGHRQRRQHLGQVQGFVAARVVQAHIAQGQRGDPGGGRGLDGSDGHAHPQRACGHRFEGRPPGFGARHNPELESPPRHDQQRPDRHRQPERDTGRQRQRAQVPRGAGRGRGWSHTKL